MESKLKKTAAGIDQAGRHKGKKVALICAFDGCPRNGVPLIVSKVEVERGRECCCASCAVKLRYQRSLKSGAAWKSVR